MMVVAGGDGGGSGGRSGSACGGGVGIIRRIED